MDRNEVFTTREAADRLGVSLRTIQLWVESGKLNAWKTEGGHRRIVRDSVDRMLRKHHQDISPVQSVGSLTLLLIEDEVDTLEFYKLQILAMGLPLKVYTADNGFNGLLEIGARNPDILLTDLIMPHLDGFQLIRTLRNNPKYSHIETIVVTALSETQLINRGGLPSSVTIIHKPLSLEALRQILEDKLQAKKMAAHV
jgi:excisionase family DNA binding protein